MAAGEARACPHDDARTSAWPWRNGCHAEFPEITADYVGAFDLNDYTAQTWTMTDAAGHVIASVRIRIESRA